MMSDQTLRDQLLKSWSLMNQNLKKLTLPDLRRCLELELAGKARVAMVNRLQGRICRLERQAQFSSLGRKLTRAQARRRA